VQSLSHAVGAKFGFTYKIVYDVHKCVSCGLCVKECPMSALQLKGNELSYQRLNCITCNQCVEMCPKKALACARGADGWERKGLGVPLPLAENNLEA
jgi:formate hydrogenlyase subunit 6/NADH:ubiquinone oxidoreductase subunit I